MPHRHPLATAALLACGLLAASAMAQTMSPQEVTVLRARHVCVACHGDGGRSDNPNVPSIAGQTREYLVAQLKDFRAQIRVEPGPRGYMWGISALLDDDTIKGLADYYAGQKPPTGKKGDAALVQAGRTLYVDGAPDRGVRACASCHGDAAEGAKVFPRLAGQHADYVVTQLKDFGTALRPHALVMRNEAQALTATEMRALAEYVQSR
jgi:cytochrome c553